MYEYDYVPLIVLLKMKNTLHFPITIINMRYFFVAFHWSVKANCSCCSSNKIRKTRLEHGLSKFEQSVIVNLMSISWLFCVYTTVWVCSRHCYLLNHHLMANICEKAISISGGNLNLGRSCLITTVMLEILFQQDRNCCFYIVWMETIYGQHHLKKQKKMFLKRLIRSVCQP